MILQDLFLHFDPCPRTRLPLFGGSGGSGVGVGVGLGVKTSLRIVVAVWVFEPGS